MGKTVRHAPDWAAIGVLYAELERVERRSPGSTRARDLEDAVSLLIDGRVSSSHARHVTFDAVRRARFLRAQATRKRTEAVARAGTLTALPRAPLPSRGESQQLEPVDRVTPEDIVVASELMKDIGRAGPGVAKHAPVVLDMLLADQPPAAMAERLQISRSTVDRCVVHLRCRTQRTLAAVAA